MEDRNEVKFTVADVLRVLESLHADYADAETRIMGYCQQVATRATNNAGAPPLVHLEMEVKYRDRLHANIQHVYRAVRILNQATKQYR